ncbi:MAG: hypothetical protein AAGA68_23170 [Pseudomonadota bacterium]
MSTPNGALPSPLGANAEDVRRELAWDELPFWADDYSEGEVRELNELLSNLRPHGSDKSFSFDLTHRLQAYQLVGEPVGEDIPVLSFKRESIHWPLLGTRGVLGLLRDLKDDPQTVPARLLIEVTLEPPKSLTARSTQDEVHIVQTLRVLSTFSKYIVGSPAGTVTLTPGETREVQFKLTRAQTSKRVDKSVAVESSTAESAVDFNLEFQRQMKLVSNSDQSIEWSRERTRNFADSSRKSTEGGAESDSLEELADRVEKTTLKLSEKYTASRQVTLTREFESTDQETSEASRKATLVNGNRALTITYAYHHLNAIYRVHVELYDTSLLVPSLVSGGRVQMLSLDSGVRAALEGIVATEHLDESVDRVGRALKRMLAGTDAASSDGSDVRVLRAGRDDPNTSVTARATLLGDRRTSGPLPVCLRSYDQVIQTSQLHAVPHVSATSADDGTNGEE